MSDFQDTATRPRCEQCGCEVVRQRPRGGKGSDALRFCTRACAFAAQRVAGIASRQRTQQRREAERLARAALRPPRGVIEPQVIRSYTCKQCAVPIHILAEKGKWRQVCDDCRSDNQQAVRRSMHYRRQARLRGAKDAERIDPVAVLDACGWFCACCCAPTPKRKRGTVALDAPEIDHVIPLARGGLHTWANLQCLCRRCNQLKSDRVLSNLELLILVYA